MLKRFDEVTKGKVVESKGKGFILLENPRLSKSRVNSLQNRLSKSRIDSRKGF